MKQATNLEVCPSCRYQPDWEQYYKHFTNVGRGYCKYPLPGDIFRNKLLYTYDTGEIHVVGWRYSTHTNEVNYTSGGYNQTSTLMTKCDTWQQLADTKG